MGRIRKESAMSRAIRFNTISRLIEANHRLAIYCYNKQCQHSVWLDLPALAGRLGPDHGIMHRDLAPRFKCSKCGGKRIGFRLHPQTGPLV